MSGIGSKSIPILTESERVRFWSRVVRCDNGCWEWSGAVKKRMPYGILFIRKQSLIAHRVAFFDATGIDPSGKVVAHRCDNPKCCSPYHLFLTTDAGNNADRDSKGRHIALRGERHGMSKLSDEERLLIANSSERTGVLAKRFNVNEVTIQRLRKQYVGSINHRINGVCN